MLHWLLPVAGYLLAHMCQSLQKEHLSLRTCAKASRKNTSTSDRSSRILRANFLMCVISRSCNSCRCWEATNSALLCSRLEAWHSSSTCFSSSNSLTSIVRDCSRPATLSCSGYYNCDLINWWILQNHQKISTGPEMQTIAWTINSRIPLKLVPTNHSKSKISTRNSASGASWLTRHVVNFSDLWPFDEIVHALLAVSMLLVNSGLA